MCLRRVDGATSPLHGHGHLTFRVGMMSDVTRQMQSVRGGKEDHRKLEANTDMNRLLRSCFKKAGMKSGCRLTKYA